MALLTNGVAAFESKSTEQLRALDAWTQSLSQVQLRKTVAIFKYRYLEK